MIPFAALSLSLSGILQNSITSAFSLFGQFLSYLINLPTSAWAYIAYIFSLDISWYGDLILPMMVVIFGITFLIVFTIVSSSESIDKSVDLGNLMGGTE